MTRWSAARSHDWEPMSIEELALCEGRQCSLLQSVNEGRQSGRIRTVGTPRLANPPHILIAWHPKVALGTLQSTTLDAVRRA